MENTLHQLYGSLAEGHKLGPSHHRFLLKRRIDTTPLGQLWAAEDLSVQGSPLVALECIDPTLTADSAATEALKRAVTYGKKLRHKHILSLHGLFSDPSGLVLVSSEPLEPTSLASLLKEGQTRKLKDNQLKGLLLQLAAALDTAFSSVRQLHGALCPALVRVSRGSGIKLGGFGIAKLLDRLPAEGPHTRRYRLYTAPEMHQRDEPSRPADIFSFACITYEVLTGSPPFASTESPEQCDPQRLSKPRQLTELQWSALQGALASAPAERPGSCVELIRKLFQPDPEAAVDEQPQADTAPAPVTAETIDDSVSTSAPTQKSRRSLKLPTLPNMRLPATFVAGIVIGYLLAQYFPAQPVVAPAVDTATSDSTSSVPAEPASPSAPVDTAPVVETGTTHAAASPTDTPTPEQLLQAQLSEPEAPRALVFKDQIDARHYGPDMVALPLGSFMMGDGHKQGDDNEYPVHQVTIRHPFAISRFEVTFAQYDLFAQTTGRALPDDEGWGRGTRPVINVSWRDAAAYASWLEEKTGQPYRLPSEAEWEYAARAGTQTVFAWGNEPKFGYAVCDQCGSSWDGAQTAPIGSLQANAWGLYDMAGNVSEWVADCYTPDYHGAPTDGSTRRTDGCNDRVMRGGSWFDIVRLVRPAGRYRHPPGAKQNDWGFRVALDLPQPMTKRTP